MSGEKVNIVNRKARFNFEILEKIEAGLVLEGAEVKSIRAGKISLAEAYCKFRDTELYLLDCHISPYERASTHKSISPTKPRKILLRKTQLRRLLGKVTERGLTIIPLRVYNVRHLIKIEIALARGKKKLDKREEIKKRDLEREVRRFGKFLA